MKTNGTYQALLADEYATTVDRPEPVVVSCEVWGCPAAGPVCDFHAGIDTPSTRRKRRP